MWALDRKFSGVSQALSRFRGWIQAGATLLTNLHLPNFLKGGLYQGAGKTVCVPGLNCYSCPAASGACPIGAFQAVVGSSKFSFSYYITGFLILLGVLEGAIPLSLANSGIRAALGSLFTWKFSLLLAVIVLSIVFYRPFCKWLCPLGAFYALLNKVSLFQMQVDKSKCVSCGKCAKACKMDVDVTKTPNHTECIRCGMCIRACPTDAVSFRYGFGSGKQTTNETVNEEKTEESK